MFDTCRAADTDAVRVLVVEDETRMAALLKRGLEEEGYAVDLAADGDEGLYLAVENDYDVVLLDAMLPGLSGYDVCRQMRERRRWAPVLMLTARDGIADRVAGLGARADLPAVTRALLRRGSAERAPVLEIGDLTLDPAAHSVTRAGQTVDLTA